MAVAQTEPRRIGGWEHRTRATVNFLGPILILLLVWEGIARAGILSPFLFPPPSAIFAKMFNLMSASRDYILWKHMARSLYRLAAGFASAALVGVMLGTAMGLSARVYRFFSPILSILIPIPSIAWVPIVILWLGLGDRTPITIVFLSAIFPIIYNTAAGVRGINKKHLWAAQTMGATRIQIFTGVVMPSALASILTGLRLGLAASWRSLVGAEMLAATGWGVGYMIFEAKDFLQVKVMYAGILTLAILGFILENGIFVTIERRTLRRWGMIRE